MSQLKNFNIRILKNTSKEIDQINLIGIDDIESKSSIIFSACDPYVPRCVSEIKTDLALINDIIN